MAMKKRIIIAILFFLAAVLLLFAGLYRWRPDKAVPGFALLAAGPDAPVISTGTFSQGDSIETVLGRAVPYSDILAIAASLKKAGAGFVQAGDLYAVGLSTSGEARRFALARGEALYRVQKGSAGIFTCQKGTLPVITSARETRGTVENSLWEAMSACLAPPAVIMEFADIFAWKIDFLTEPRKGDSFALSWEERRTALGAPCPAKITGAVYRGAETGEEYAFYYGDSYYDEKGGSLRRAFLRAPLSYRRISSYFNPRRYHPVLRIFRPHSGIDYAAPGGTPVSAVADGTVSFAGRKGGYGKFIELRHGAAYVTGYGHLRAFAKGVKAGKKVSQGSVIGYVGMTGLATGPHLDFSIKKNGRFVNFLKLELPPAASLRGAQLEKFLDGIKPLRAGLERTMGKPQEGGLI